MTRRNLPFRLPVVACAMAVLATAAMGAAPELGGVAEEMLAIAKSSPELAGRHDKARWMAVFAPGAVVEDPVGAPVHTDIGLFFDTFIAPNNVSFEVHNDMVDVERGVVIRDVHIHITPVGGSGGMRVPVIILYPFDDARKRLVALRAFWNVAAVEPTWDTPVDLLKFAWTGTLQFGRIISALGVGFTGAYTMGFTRGLLSGGDKIVDDFVGAVNGDDSARLLALFTHSDAPISLPNGVMTAATLAQDMRASLPSSLVHFDPRKVRLSGHTTAAMLAIPAIPASAPEASNAQACEGGSDRTLAAFFQIDANSGKLVAADIFF